MGIADQLQGLLDGLEGVKSVTFGDLSSKMALLSKSHTKIPQEKLDSLCSEAAALLNGAAAGLSANGAPVTALSSGAAGMNIFLRTRPKSSDILCCICAPDADLTAVLPAARACLEHIETDA